MEERKKGILSTDGARRLGVPHLAGAQVEYEPGQHERLGEFAKRIYHEDRWLGGGMALGTDGVISCDYAEQMKTLLASLNKDGARELAAKELASHGHPDAPEWAINDWLETYENFQPEPNKK
jgi:hypothetical protein